MAALHLVTGYSGTPHITAADQGSFNAGIIGLDKYVLGTGSRFKAEIVTANAVRIYDGDLVMNGRHIRLAYGDFLDCIISNGTSGTVRNDLIVVRYNKHLESGVESVTFMVYQGSAVSSNPTDPSTLSFDILEGTLTADFPLYRVRLNGVSIEAVEPLFSVVAPMDEMQRHYYPQNLIINSDFQCNQRKLPYENTWESISTASTYTLDMWRGYAISLKVATNGVKISAISAEQGYFTQFVKVNSLASKYTLCVRADGVSYRFTTTVSTTVSEDIHDKFKIRLRYMTEGYIKVDYCPLTMDYVTVGYIDLYEGEYAYPHVREDYGVALARCEQYVKCGQFICPIVYSYVNSSGLYSYKVAIPHGRMENTASVTIDYWQYTSSNGATASGGGGNVLATTGGQSTSYARFDYKTERHKDCTAVEVSCVISCEPDL